MFTLDSVHCSLNILVLELVSCWLPLDVRGVVAVAVAGPAQRVGQHQVRPLLPARQRPVAQIV